MKKFDFLPELPKPNLDDRKFEDLVAECILRIPRYCPEWTNHNPGDPGITLIELFAWLTDQMLLRFNQVPIRNYIVFLELLGIRLDPPKPAGTALTFYLSKARNEPVTVPKRTEVATFRTETEPAVIFTTDADLVIGNPIIRHFLTATDYSENLASAIQNRTLRDRQATGYGLNPSVNSNQIEPSQWWNLGTVEEVTLFEDSEPGNCFYLVITDQNPDISLAGNVIALTFRGEAARTTGIDPDNPPLRWEAWSGKEWQATILRQPQDDHTKGFSFQATGNQGSNALAEGADLILHLPQQLPQTDFGTNYTGHWLRCVYQTPNQHQPGYSRSPSIVGMKIKAIGGAVNASHCVQVKNELLGISDGKPGQTFELQGKPVLDREPGEEYIRIHLPWEERYENWQEVHNFANSGVEDLHYMIDSNTGTVQFGPLVREPRQLKQQTKERSYLQSEGRIVRRTDGRLENILTPAPPSTSVAENLAEEWQYGKIPPPGAEIYMVAYRTGGGKGGNVQREKLTMIKSSLPHIKSVTNYEAAQGGQEAESLENAVIRVPEMLRTRECAVTPADFERVAKQAPIAVARAHCLKNITPGVVSLLVVPDIPTAEIDFAQGMNPDEYFALEPIKTEIQAYMDEHKPLGIQVQLEEPEYIGVKVETEVIVEPKYAGDTLSRKQIERQLLIALYRFLNPLTGGIPELGDRDKNSGWRLGRSLYPSDIIGLCQKIPGVSYLGEVKLYRIHKHPQQGWFLSPAPQPEINPGKLGLICSWDSQEQEFGHHIRLIS